MKANLFKRVQLALWNSKGETYVDTGVKMLLAIVIGALLLTGIYGIFSDIVLTNVSGTIENFFDQTPSLNGGGGNGNGGQQQQVITFTIRDVHTRDVIGEYQAEEGMTWREWYNSEFRSDCPVCGEELEISYDRFISCIPTGYVINQFNEEEGWDEAVEADSIINPDTIYSMAHEK